jgi:hypothetical protein
LKLVVKPLPEIDDPPADDAVYRRVRTAFDDRCKSDKMRGVQKRRLAGRLLVDQPLRPQSVELDNPVSNHLQGHATHLGRLVAGGAVVNLGQRQKPSRLSCILRRSSRSPNLHSVKIQPKRRPTHGEPPVRHFESSPSQFRNRPVRVTPSEIWYKPSWRKKSVAGQFVRELNY